jgi:hypothetical protein
VAHVGADDRVSMATHIRLVRRSRAPAICAPCHTTRRNHRRRLDAQPARQPTTGTWRMTYGGTCRRRGATNLRHTKPGQMPRDKRSPCRGSKSVAAAHTTHTPARARTTPLRSATQILAETSCHQQANAHGPYLDVSPPVEAASAPQRGTALHNFVRCAYSNGTTSPCKMTMPRA